MAGVTLNHDIKSQIIRNAELTVKLDDNFKDEAVEIHSETITGWLENAELLRFVAANKEKTNTLLRVYREKPYQRTKEAVTFPVIVDVPDHLLEWDRIKYEATKQATAYNAHTQGQPTAVIVLVTGDYKGAIPPSITNYQNNVRDLETHTYSWYAREERPSHSSDGDTRKKYLSLSWDEAPTAVQTAVETYLTRNRSFQKREKIKNDLRDLLKECRTVGQFLKAFPEGEHLLPDWVIRKLHEKAAPKKKKTVEFDSDLSHVKQSILINKIGAA